MEKSISFKNKAGQRLYGILHVPDNPGMLGKRIGVNLLNPGLKNRVAPNRLNIKIARKLCEMGFYVLRFDPFGIGDSEGDLSKNNDPVMDLWGFIQKGIFVDDTICSNDFFVSEYNIEDLILIGQCGAGVTAGLTGAIDQRVNSMILIDTPFRISSNISLDRSVIESYNPLQLLKEHIEDFIRFNWLTKIFSGDQKLSYVKSKIGILKKILSDLKSKNENAISERFNNKLEESLNVFFKNGKNVSFIFAENDYSLREFNNDYFPNFLENKPGFKDRYSIDVIKNANHIYTEIKWQDELLKKITEWLVDENKFYTSETLQPVNLKVSITNYFKSKEEIIDVLNRNRSKLHDEEYFHWKHVERAKIHGDPIVFFGKLENDNVIGNITLYPSLINDSFGVSHIYCNADLAVDEGFRRKGIFTHLQKVIQDTLDRNAMYICFPNLPAQMALYGSGYKVIANLKCYTLPLLAKKFPLLYKAICISNRFTKHAIESLRSEINKEETAYQISEIKGFNSEFDELWLRMAKQYRLIFCRNKKCLEVRYHRNPDNKDIKLFQIRRNGILKGYIAMVFKNEKLCSIIDIFYEDLAVFIVLIEHAIKYAEELNFKRLEFFLNDTNEDEARVLLMNGFLKRKGKVPILGYIDRDHQLYNKFMDSRNWFITMADKEV